MTPALAAAPGSLPDNIYYVTAGVGEPGNRRRGERDSGGDYDSVQLVFGANRAGAGECHRLERVRWHGSGQHSAAEQLAARDRGGLGAGRCGSTATGRKPGCGQAPSYVQALDAESYRGADADNDRKHCDGQDHTVADGAQRRESQPGGPGAERETAVAPLGTAQILAENVALELVERATAVHYPAVNVYCEKIANQLVEKFRTFSGISQMAIEVRHSQDR